jgi:hypothetical protein
MLLSILLPLLYSAIFFFSFPSIVSFVIFAVGIVVGSGMILVDRILHAFYLFPEHEFNVLIREEWRKKNIFGVLKMLQLADPYQDQLMTRSVLFLVIYWILAVFVLTSTGSVLGVGIILGMGLRYVIDFWNVRKQPEVFVHQFLWQVRHQFTKQQVNFIIAGWMFGFAMLTLLVLL